MSNRIAARRRALLAAALAAACALELPTMPQLDIDVRFGILEGSGGDARFIETRSVPNVVGQAFGWKATLPPHDDPIPWSEEFTAPKAPLVWNGATQLSPDRKAAITRGIIPPGETELAHFWTIVPGDPTGTHQIVVKLYDGTVAEFSFELR